MSSGISPLARSLSLQTLPTLVSRESTTGGFNQMRLLEGNIFSSRPTGQRRTATRARLTTMSLTARQRRRFRSSKVNPVTSSMLAGVPREIPLPMFVRTTSTFGLMARRLGSLRMEALISSMLCLTGSTKRKSTEMSRLCGSPPMVNTLPS